MVKEEKDKIWEEEEEEEDLKGKLNNGNLLWLYTPNTNEPYSSYIV